jgi:hypothetical protein
VSATSWTSDSLTPGARSAHASSDDDGNHVACIPALLHRIACLPDEVVPRCMLTGVLPTRPSWMRAQCGLALAVILSLELIRRDLSKSFSLNRRAAGIVWASTHCPLPNAPRSFCQRRRVSGAGGARCGRRNLRRWPAQPRRRAEALLRRFDRLSGDSIWRAAPLNRSDCQSAKRDNASCCGRTQPGWEIREHRAWRHLLGYRGEQQQYPLRDVAPA